MEQPESSSSVVFRWRWVSAYPRLSGPGPYFVLAQRLGVPLVEELQIGDTVRFFVGGTLVSCPPPPPSITIRRREQRLRERLPRSSPRYLEQFDEVDLPRGITVDTLKDLGTIQFRVKSIAWRSRIFEVVTPAGIEYFEVSGETPGHPSPTPPLRGFYGQGNGVRSSPEGQLAIGAQSSKDEFWDVIQTTSGGFVRFRRFLQATGIDIRNLPRLPVATPYKELAPEKGQVLFRRISHVQWEKLIPVEFSDVHVGDDGRRYWTEHQFWAGNGPPRKVPRSTKYVAKALEELPRELRLMVLTDQERSSKL